MDPEARTEIETAIVIAHIRLEHVSLDPKLRRDQEREILDEAIDTIIEVVGDQ